MFVCFRLPRPGKKWKGMFYCMSINNIDKQFLGNTEYFISFTAIVYSMNKEWILLVLSSSKLKCNIYTDIEVRIISRRKLWVKDNIGQNRQSLARTCINGFLSCYKCFRWESISASSTVKPSYVGTWRQTNRSIFPGNEPLKADTSIKWAIWKGPF